MSSERRPGFLHVHDARITRVDDDRQTPARYRLITAEDLRERQRVATSPFYGYSVELLAQWCMVSVETAARWKRHEAEPSRQAMALFELHRDRRVLGDAWPGWLVNGNRLVDPEGNETTQGQLRAYAHVYQLVRELARRDPAAAASLEAILREVA